MKKITLNDQLGDDFLEVFQMFLTSRAAMGVTDITLRNYNYFNNTMCAASLRVNHPTNSCKSLAQRVYWE